MNGLSTTARHNKSHAQRAERKALTVPGRLTWKDSRGMVRFASVTTRNVSETGVFIECHEKTTIPLYRMVTFQIEREARNIDGLPQALRSGKVLSVVYRTASIQRSTGTPEGYGLRLLVEPSARSQSSAAQVEATA